MVGISTEVCQILFPPQDVCQLRERYQSSLIALWPSKALVLPLLVVTGLGLACLPNEGQKYTVCARYYAMVTFSS